MEEVIKPQGKFRLNIRELYLSRELIFFFAWRDIKVKYKQTFLGIIWVVLQPIMLMLVFTTLLGTKFKSEFQDGNYSIYVLSGLICWNLFSSSVLSSGNSIVSNSNIIKKVYFPRLVIPISSIISSMVDFVISLLVYLFVLFFFHDLKIVWSGFIYLPISILLTILAAIGFGSLVSALNVKYRDFRYVLPFFLQLLMFVSPIFLILNTNDLLEFIFALNPMYAPLQLFRYHFLGSLVDWKYILFSVGFNVLLFFCGIFVFRKMEEHFADLV